MKQAERSVIVRVIADSLRKLKAEFAAELTELRKAVEAKAERGEPGPKGEKGDPGRNGRDAASELIIRQFDSDREYRDGDLLTLNGGLFKKAGDDLICLIDGLSSIEIEQKSEREFGLKVTLASGTEKTFPVTVPALVYRGVWKEGSYAQNDCVTYSGSMWIAKKETSIKPGEYAGDWQLAVKQGRAGRSAA